MATETFFLPGYGVVVDANDGDEVFIPGYGIVANEAAVAAAVVSIRSVPYRRRQARTAWRIPELDRANALSDGLVGWFDLGHGLQAIPDVTGITRHAKADNTSGDLSVLDTHIGRAINFSGDATDDRVDLGPISPNHPLGLAGRDRLSIFSWARKDDPGVFAGVGRIIDKSDGTNGTNGYSFAARAGADRVQFGVDGTFGAISPDLNIDDGRFHHIGVVRRNTGTGGVTFYLDGLELGGATEGGTIPAAATNAAIGNWNHTTDRMWPGPIATVGVWNRDLSQSEILALYQDPWQLYRQPNALMVFPPEAAAAAAVIGHNLLLSRTRNRLVI
jgi:hypothetical protein